MGKMSPGFVRAQKAAEFLDMKPHEFRALVDAGASDAEIASVTGHKALAMVQHYRKGAGQKALSKRAQKMRE